MTNEELRKLVKDAFDADLDGAYAIIQAADNPISPDDIEALEDIAAVGKTEGRE